MQLYKPNSSNKGSALSVNYSAKTDKPDFKGDKSFYFQLVAQNGWDNETKNGKFKDGKKIITKFAPHEIAGILAAIDRNTSLANVMNVKYVYHDSDKFSSNVTFEPYFKSEKRGTEWVKTENQVGFSLRITKTDKANTENKDSIAIGLTWAETKLLYKVLDNGLTHISDSWYSENIARGTEKKEKLAKSSPKQEKVEPVKEQESEPSPAPESADLDF